MYILVSKIDWTIEYTYPGIQNGSTTEYIYPGIQNGSTVEYTYPGIQNAWRIEYISWYLKWFNRIHISWYPNWLYMLFYSFFSIVDVTSGLVNVCIQFIRWKWKSRIFSSSLFCFVVSFFNRVYQRKLIACKWNLSSSLFLQTLPLPNSMLSKLKGNHTFLSIIKRYCEVPTIADLHNCLTTV